MATTDDKKEFILENEYRLANRLALEIMPKPQLSIWMILIPIIFVYYFYELNRFSNGKKEFVRQFVKSRRLLLEEACSELTTGNRVDLLNLVEKENVPDCAKEEFRSWAKILGEHYLNLLKTEGDNFADLVRSYFKEQRYYLTALDQIAKAESRFYKALQPDLNGKVENAGATIFNIEKASARLRREAAEALFVQCSEKSVKKKS